MHISFCYKLLHPLLHPSPVISLDAGIPELAGREIAGTELTEGQLATLRGVIQDLGVEQLAEGITFVLIPGQLAHYGIGRRQIYLDLNLLNNPFELSIQLAHEIVERADVIRGLGREIGIEERAQETINQIEALARESHARIIQMGEREALETVKIRELG